MILKLAILNELPTIQKVGLYILLNNFWCFKKLKKAKGGLLGLLVLLLALAVRADAAPVALPPDANQEFLRQQEREQILREQQEKTPDIKLLKQTPSAIDQNKLPINESPCFNIERILLVGEMAEEFQWALEAANETDNGKNDPAIKRCLGTRGINLVMRRIQNSIVERGYVTTRVLAGPQDISSGTLKLTLVPGLIHNIGLASEAESYYSAKWNAVPTYTGDLLNLRDIEQALENYKRPPTVDADIQIIPAVATDPLSKLKPGESDLVIHRKQKFPLRLSLSADDAGAKATGKYQGSLTLSGDNLGVINDLFYFNLAHNLSAEYSKRGTRGYTIHYSIPFNY